MMRWPTSHSETAGTDERLKWAVARGNMFSQSFHERGYAMSDLVERPADGDRERDGRKRFVAEEVIERVAHSLIVVEAALQRLDTRVHRIRGCQSLFGSCR